ncbi:unnamed protein product [Schistosoma mattheei]|uniref:Uncharacterized protein n=1 Tax=Schistosoma mattheei TaxID=31246 RepID=A0A183NIM0_9TREM|nr:unnamed protein product [Schistosoma mattheei]
MYSWVVLLFSTLQLGSFADFILNFHPICSVINFCIHFQLFFFRRRSKMNNYTGQYGYMFPMQPNYTWGTNPFHPLFYCHLSKNFVGIKNSATQ